MSPIQNGNNVPEAASGALSDVYHDVNNPLAVIAGNAQLLLEMARALELGDEFVEPIQDIEEAGERIGDVIGALEMLKKNGSNGSA